MKKFFATFLAIIVLLFMVSCNKSPDEKIEINVFAAASMTETLNEIIELYKTVSPDVKIVATYDSSGTLKTQIEEGADCDLFISAAQKQMDQLDISKDETVNPERLDFVLSDTRINLLENKVVLAVPQGNPSNVNDFSDLANCDLIALGNSDVPVGSYSVEILEYLNLNLDQLESNGQITYGTNVKEVTTHISEATVDCGIIYATDAFSEGLTVVDQATDEMCSQVIYPAAVIKSGNNPEEAQAFLDYLTGTEATEVFEKVGFTSLS